MSFSYCRTFKVGPLPWKLFAVELYNENYTNKINFLKLLRALVFAISLLPFELLTSISLENFYNIRHIAVGLFSLNVFAVRHFALIFWAKHFCRLLFLSRIYIIWILTVRLYFFVGFIAVGDFAFILETFTVNFSFVEFFTTGVFAVSFFLCSFSLWDILLRGLLQSKFSL